MSVVARLTGTVKHYDWGGSEFIPSLLALATVPQKPFAEFWMGVHPQADCKIQWADGSEISLRTFMATDAEKKLGAATFRHFGQLPYLFKALDVKDMLSIQVHPAKAAAVADFAAENEKGVALDDPRRNYKDQNHKPELMVAIGDFWLLHGFRAPEALKSILTEKQNLQFLLPVFEQGGYELLYRTVMEMDQEAVNSHLQPLLDEIIPLYQAGQLNKMHPDFWAARAAVTFNGPGRIDRGIFSVYLFNLVFMQRGQAIFQDAGMPHAYLEGHNIEIMASSDNVLRGGLTTKHIDVPELLKHTRCEATIPNVLTGEVFNGIKVYKTPAPDFELSTITLKAGESMTYEANGTEIYLITEGDALLEAEDDSVQIKAGTPSAIQWPGAPVKIIAQSDCLIFKAAVPVDK